MGPEDDESLPPLRKPSQMYVDNYIARSGATPAPRTAALTPRSGPARKAARIFYPLEERCPAHYYPDLHLVSSGSMLMTRRTLLVMCVLQLIASIVILAGSDNLHNGVDRTFTVAANLVSSVASVLGFAGVLVNNRSLLLFFYINQLFGLSNVCTIFLMQLDENSSGVAACKMLRRGDLTDEQARQQGLDCDAVEGYQNVLLLVMLFLLGQLWASCLLAKTYMEMVQDLLNDNDDHALVDFIWERRRETWVQLRRFEDVVQRQFEARRCRPSPARACSRLLPRPRRRRLRTRPSLRRLAPLPLTSGGRSCGARWSTATARNATCIRRRRAPPSRRAERSSFASSLGACGLCFLSCPSHVSRAVLARCARRRARRLFLAPSREGWMGGFDGGRATVSLLPLVCLVISVLSNLR